MQTPSFLRAFLSLAAIAVPSIAFAQSTAAAAPPSKTPTPLTATCTLGDHYGVDPDDARVAADLICNELAKENVPAAAHEVRFGKLGKRTVVTLASRNGSTYDERRVLVSHMEEVHTASPRLVSALASGKPLEETRNVDNVLSAETTTSETRGGSFGFEPTLFGGTGIGASSGATAGGGAGALFRIDSIGLLAQGRGGGIGSVEPKLILATFDLGLRYYITRSDFSPFVGGGFGLGYHLLRRGQGSTELEGSGFGSYVQLGAELLRTHHTAFTVSARFDAPFYTLEGVRPDGIRDSRYVSPLSLNVGLQFH